MNKNHSNNVRYQQMCSIHFYSFIFFCSLILVTFLSACSSSNGKFRLEGRFKNMNQGEFYLYDAERGWKDTIGVRDGRFVYELALKDTTTLLLLFPNYSELPIFARPGVKIKMNGDATHLRGTTIKGSDENEEMTGFRLKANQQTPPEVIKSAKDYITDNPASPVSFYLLQRYFIQNSTPNYSEAEKLCQLIQQATGNGLALRLSKQLAILKNAQTGSQLPRFNAKDTNGKTITEKQLKKDINVICLWSSWNYESRNIMTKIRKLRKNYPDKIAVVSVCIDATQTAGRDFLKRDSIDWPNICDGKMWQSPICTTMGFTTIPANIVTNKNGKIIARNLSDAKEMEEKLKNLLK